MDFSMNHEPWTMNHEPWTIMTQPHKIVVDAMGGDYAPQAVIAGVVDAIKEFNVHITLVGIKEQVEEELKKYNYSKDRIEIIHAP